MPAEPIDQRFDLCVVGAGPAGIAAAVTAAEAQLRVALVDDNPHAGGQIWRHRGGGPPSAEGRRWLARLAKSYDRITHLVQSRVVCHLGDRSLLVERPMGPVRIASQSIVLATGARELFLPFAGWTLPGVVGAGAMQALLKSGLSVAGKRVVVAGTGPLLLAVAHLLKASGAVVPTIVEQTTARRLGRLACSLWRTPGKLAAAVHLRASLWNVPLLTSSYVTRASPRQRGLQIELAMPNRHQTIDCDLLACGFHLIANLELPRLLGCKCDSRDRVAVDDFLRTSVPGVFAVGELTGVGGVEKALLEGQIAGHAAAGNERAARSLLRARASYVDFALRLDEAFDLRPELLTVATPETIVCRCEDVRLAALDDSRDARDARLQSRCGMGPCQGRICAPIVQRLRGFDPPTIRPPIIPTAVGVLAQASPPPQSS